MNFRFVLALSFLFLGVVFQGEASESLSSAKKNVSVEKEDEDSPDSTDLPEDSPGASSSPDDSDSKTPDQSQPESAKIVTRMWEASSRNDLEELKNLRDQCEEQFGKTARKQQASLKQLPTRGQESRFEALNHVGTCLFIYAEALMNNGLQKDAIEAFEYAIGNYRFSQAWDPRGWYWSIAEKSQASIDVMLGKVEEEPEFRAEDFEVILPTIHTPGTEDVIDYTRYGEFLNVGTEKYHYRVTDKKGLAAAVGEGIYPNIRMVYRNPRYKEVRDEGRLEGSHWDFVNTVDLEAAYFKWFTAPEPWGLRMFYVGMIFEKAGMMKEALKAYHTLIVHFPKTVGYTYWQTPWYPAQAAIGKIRHIIRTYPELNLEDLWMRIEMENGFDNTPDNDVTRVWPGKIVRKGVIEQVAGTFPWRKKAKLGDVVRTLGEGQVQLHEYENGHWQMTVDGEPFFIKGITYAPTPVGQSPDKGTLHNWMEADLNENGKIDGPYDAWVDKNRNNQQDDDEPAVGDFQLLKELGANAIRIYHIPETPNKELLRKLYEDHGIYVIMGDFLGKYAIGSGASWAEGTDYTNPEHRANMMENVKKMVMENKDEPYVLMWLLGNENNYGVACNADKKPEAYFKFANEVAQWIKSVDPDHPVALVNGDTLYLDKFAQHAPDIDMFSANVYRGNYGFGSFWQQVKGATGKPAFITEYGSPAYAPQLTLEQAEKAQAAYHRGNWMDIEDNFAGSARGEGNALGGIVFQWMDEWWKNYEPYRHDRKSDAVGPFPGGYYFEEWFGIVGQGNGRHSPYLRQLRESYFLYKELWNK